MRRRVTVEFFHGLHRVDHPSADSPVKIGINTSFQTLVIMNISLKTMLTAFLA